MKKICIVGHFGGDKVFLDGQTVKTKILYKELSKRISNRIVCVDTYYNSVNKVKLLINTVWGIINCKKIIVLLSGNGMRIFFPILYWAKILFNKEVYHDVIGGNLDKYVEENPEYAKYLNSFNGNWVEYDGLKKRLEAQGVKNCVVMPNFKDLDSDLAMLDIDEIGKCSLCMFSRVLEEKGMTDAIEVLKEYNGSHEQKFKLNIWGPIDVTYISKFEKLCADNSFVSYNGCVDYGKSVEILTNHIALLFPTRWFGEGFPGTILDAYASGLPVVATDWFANKELVDNFVTGWVYPNDKIKTLKESIQWIAENKELMIEMRKKCLKRYQKYTPDAVMKDILNAMNLYYQ